MDFAEVEIIKFFKCLNSNKVNYILVGGFAVNIHGFNRSTSDLDLWLADTVENRTPFVNALSEYGIEGAEIFHTLPFIAGYTEIVLDNGIAIDITRLRMVEDALKINMNEMQRMLESITDGFFAVNAKWEFTYVNKESERLLEHTRDELIGKNIWKSLPYATELKFHQELHRAYDQQESVHFEDYIVDKQKWFSVNAYPANDGLAVYFRDITEEREYRIRIEERNKLLTDIAWIQAHKIRGPVANILGLSHLFNYENPTDPINREILDSLRVTINSLDEVIKEVVQKTNLTINS